MARATTIRFSGPIYERLERASKYTGLPINAIVTAACMEWLRDQFPASIDVDAPRTLSELPTLEIPVAPSGVGHLPRLSSDAREAMQRAAEEARRFNHNYIGTEHILAGIAGDTSTTGGQALQQVGIEAAGVREAIRFIVGRGSAPRSEEPGLSPRAVNVVRRAGGEAGRRGDAEIDTAHLALGLCGESAGLALRIVESLGGDEDSVRAAVESLLS
jgi:Clp amino terminal domain, pathogenicity island component